MVLWYPLGALRLLSEKAGFDVPLSEAERFVGDLLTAKTLPIFVWAGRLWEQRDLKVEDVQAKIEWSSRPALELLMDVRRALILGLTGRDTKEEADERAVVPQEPTPLNGAGHAPSVSVSAS